MNTETLEKAKVLESKIKWLNVQIPFTEKGIKPDLVELTFSDNDAKPHVLNLKAGRYRHPEKNTIYRDGEQVYIPEMDALLTALIQSMGSALIRKRDELIKELADL